MSKKNRKALSHVAPEPPGGAPIPAPPTHQLQDLALQVSKFQGPLPPPEVLEAYNRAIPGLGQKLCELYEKQVHHRHRIEEKMLAIQDRESSLGQWLGFTIAVLALLSATLLGYLGRDVSSIGIFLAAIASLVASLYKGRSPKPGETQERGQVLR